MKAWDRILADDRLDDESFDRSKLEAIEALIGESGWEAVRDCMMVVLGEQCV